MIRRMLLQGLLAALLVAALGAAWQAWRTGDDAATTLDQVVRLGHLG